MKQTLILLPVLSIVLMGGCGSSELLTEKSTTHKVSASKVKSERKEQPSESKKFKSINDYISKTMAQQFSFLSFTKSIEGNELITKVRFSADNIINPKFKSTENQFYWSVQLTPSLFEEMKTLPKPVTYKILSKNDLSKQEQKKSLYSNYYQVEQRFEISKNDTTKVKELISKKNPGFAFKIHDENKEEAYVFVDLESFVDQK